MDVSHPRIGCVIKGFTVKTADDDATGTRDRSFLAGSTQTKHEMREGCGDTLPFRRSEKGFAYGSLCILPDGGKENRFTRKCHFDIMQCTIF